MREFFKQYYAPNNATLAIAGDINKPATKKLIEKYFGSLKRGPAVPPIKVETPTITAERRLVVTDRVELPRVYMAWFVPSFFSAGGPDAEIAAGILGQGRSSRLYKKLVYEKQLAQSVFVEHDSAMLGSMFIVQATARPGRTVEELEAAMDAELERMRTELPLLQEVDRVRNVSETRLLSGLQLVGGFGGVADQLNYWNHYVGTPDYLTQDVTRRRNVTPDSVRRFAQTYLQNSARVVVHGVPGPKVSGPRTTHGSAGSGRRRARRNQCGRAVEEDAAHGGGCACGACAGSADVSARERADGDCAPADGRHAVGIGDADAFEAAAMRIRSTSRGWRALRPPCWIRAPAPATPCSWPTTPLRLARRCRQAPRAMRQP